MRHVPVATVTPTTIRWQKGYVVAPDAFHHRAIVDFDRTSGLIEVKNRQNVLTASYTLADGHTYTDTDAKLRGTIEGDGGDVWVSPDSGCDCQGYKRTAR